MVLNDAINIFWFRRDLRLEDNHGLFKALSAGLPIVPIFIFDKNILDRLANQADARVTFIHDQLSELQNKVNETGSTLDVRYGFPEKIWTELLNDYKVNAVYTNHDYEPYAKERDNKIAEMLRNNGTDFHTFKDQVIFEKDEVTKDDGKPYTVFTPYSRKWKARFQQKGINQFPSETLISKFAKQERKSIPSLESMGFERSALEIPAKYVAQGIIKHYDKTRNFPAIKGTSKLGIHFRFGTISIREKARKAAALNETYLNELIWRDFYHQILWHFPQVVDKAFKPKYDNIEWVNDEAHFKAWCDGKTGYPIVDAGMRELNTTGYMHNRVRMITASFLTKSLLTDWRWGEAYFAEKLLDFDLASNSGGWQWASGSGTDAAPYFRIFNPELQTRKFDKDLVYIKRWIPEFGTPDYPEPIIEHKFARERALRVYKEALN